MAQCFEPYCSVDPASGALSITTKGGTCTVVPGDQVSVTENPQGWIITVNGVPTLIPKVDPGDDVSFLETPDNYVITINGVPHLIPKCRYYRDCDGNVLDSCERIVTCDDLAGRGFISCVDADDFNMVARNVGGVATMCLEIAWDRICAEAELVTDPAGHTVLLCGPNGVKKIDPNDLLSDICFTDVPDMGSVCALGEQLVLFNDDGCMRLGRVTTSSARSETSEFVAVAPHLPENTGGHVLPQDFPIPNDVYSTADYLADGGIDSTKHPDALNFFRAAPGLNAARIQNSRLARFTGTLECARTFDWTFSYSRGGSFASYEEADRARFYLGSRVRIRPQGGSWSPWLYPFTPGPGTLALHATFNGFEAQSQRDSSNTFPACDYEWEFFYVGAADPADNLSVAANTFRRNYATPSPRVSIKPRVIA